jgi:hypothetical protein
LHPKGIVIISAVTLTVKELQPNQRTTYYTLLCKKGAVLKLFFYLFTVIKVIILSYLLPVLSALFLCVGVFTKFYKPVTHLKNHYFRYQCLGKAVFCTQKKVNLYKIKINKEV